MKLGKLNQRLAAFERQIVATLKAVQASRAELAAFESPGPGAGAVRKLNQRAVAFERQLIKKLADVRECQARLAKLQPAKTKTG